MIILKHVAHAPLISLGAISETYMGAIAEQRPVAMPDITRLAYKQSMLIKFLSSFLKLHWKAELLT
jgi:hypothetical protein